MDPQPVALAILDISGYTNFIRYHQTTEVHAEEIIFELLEAVMNEATYPLVVNKLEGDATFLYSEIPEGEEKAVAADVVQQVQRFFSAFRSRLHGLAADHSACPCDACQNIMELRLKAVLHSGQALFRKIRQFEELAGMDVILIHRLLKNHISAPEYVAMTGAFAALAGPLPFPPAETLVEEYDDLGPVELKVYKV